MTTNKMLSRIENGVGYITFNNPEKHNAVSIEMWDALERMLDDFRSDNTVSCLLYTSPSPRDTLLSRMPSSA